LTRPAGVCVLLPQWQGQPRRRPPARCV